MKVETGLEPELKVPQGRRQPGKPAMWTLEMPKMLRWTQEMKWTRRLRRVVPRGKPPVGKKPGQQA
jgi:hypothetical protein